MYAYNPPGAYTFTNWDDVSNEARRRVLKETTADTDGELAARLEAWLARSLREVYDLNRL